MLRELWEEVWTVEQSRADVQSMFPGLQLPPAAVEGGEGSGQDGTGWQGVLDGLATSIEVRRVLPFPRADPTADPACCLRARCPSRRRWRAGRLAAGH